VPDVEEHKLFLESTDTKIVGVDASIHAIMIDKYHIIWYGAFVLEGDLQKSPSSFSLRVLLISSALLPRGLSFLGRPPK